MLQRGDYVGIVSCSDGRKENERESIEELFKVLKQLELKVIVSKHIYTRDSVFSGNRFERAASLMELYEDCRVKAIFDISGGDLCNELIDCINYSTIAKNKKPFFGYSDLTAIINAIYAKTGNSSYLYQVKNLVSEYSLIQKKMFTDTLLYGGNSLLDFNYSFIRGNSMQGIVVGGNIRCLLKLAGTEYMPNFSNKLLFIESFGGGSERTIACICHLRQLGVFKLVNGVILGQFTYMSENKCKPEIEDILLHEIDNESIPIARTLEIGHSKDSKAIKIGEYYTLEKR